MKNKKNSDLNTSLATWATKAEKIVKLKSFDSSYFDVKIFLMVMDFKICLLIKQDLVGWS